VLFAIERGAYHMPLQRELLPDRPEAREKFLCAFRGAKVAHAPQEVPSGDATLAFACRLMAVLVCME
jgi:hypothetical protein